MKILLPLFIASVFLTNRVSADLVVIDLSKGFTWKAMFDAGFRPKHLWEGNSLCSQKDVRIGFRMNADGKILELGRGDIEFTLVEGHSLTKLFFFGREDLTVSEARTRTEVFAGIFNNSVSQKAVLRELEIHESPRSLTFPFGLPGVRKTVDVKDALNAVRTKHHKIIYRFSNLASKNGDVIGHFSITLADRKLRFRPQMTTPIQPPPGYEHISLVADGAKVPAGASGAGTADAESGGAEAAKDASHSRAEQLHKPSLAPALRADWWWKIGMLLLVMASLVVLIRAVRR